MEFPKDVWKHILSYADDRVERRTAKSRKRLIREITYKSFSWRRYVGTLNNFIIRTEARDMALYQWYKNQQQPAANWYKLILRSLAIPSKWSWISDQIHLCDIKFVRFLRETKSFKRSSPVYRWTSRMHPEGSQITLAELSSTVRYEIPIVPGPYDTDDETDSD